MIRIFMVGFSNNKGGVESYISNLCSCLDENEFEVIYSMPQMNIGGKEWIRPRNRHNYIKYRLFWKRFFAENYFDVLYYNTCDIVSIDMLKFAKKAKIPVRIIHSHNTGIQQKMNIVHWCFEKWNRLVLEKYATHFFACSKVAGQWMFGKRSFHIIKNGIHISKYAYSDKVRNKRREDLKLENKFIVGCIGRLENQKNPFFTLEIFKKIVEKKNNVILFFVGEGSLESELRLKAEECGLKKQVIFAGARDDINELLSLMDCLLMPSLFEGLPFALVEAQASGLPCVVSKNVSRESDLTGLVQFVALDDEIDTWVEKVIETEKIVREQKSIQLEEKGYAIEKTVEKVKELIVASLKE